jgi:hypothetical protein
LDVLTTELEEQQRAVQCAQDKLQAERRDFHAAVWSHAAAGPPIQQGQMQQAAPPVVTHTPHRQHPWPTDPNWQPVQPSSPSFGLASELGEVMSDLDHWVCHACGRIYDNTIKDCTCQQDSPIKANQCDWLTKEAAKVYLLEIGETAVQSLKWAHEPKTEVTPKEVYAYAKAQVAEADLAILPKRVCEKVISRRLLPAIAQLKPQASPQAHRYLLQQDLSSLVQMINDRSILVEKLDMAIKAAVPAFQETSPTQPAPLPQQTAQPDPAAAPPAAAEATRAPSAPPPSPQPSAEQQLVPQTPAPVTHDMASGNTTPIHAASAPVTPADAEIPLHRQMVPCDDSPRLGGEEKRQKTGNALDPFKAKPQPTVPAASDQTPAPPAPLTGRG